MRDRLTLKAGTHRAADQAADRQHPTPQAPGQRQPQELQTAFLAGMLNQTVTVYLINGIKLTGTLKQHDLFTLQLQGVEGVDSVVFKHAISTIAPGMPAGSRGAGRPSGKRPEWIE
jgi:host factor-I protein